MSAKPRAVIDTGPLISRLLTPRSGTAEAVRKAIDNCVILASPATLDELAAVLARAKFDPYVTREERAGFIGEYLNIVEIVETASRIHACRDASDDKFLDLAVQGGAEWLITGDSDLLVLHPFLGVRILSPADFLKQMA